MTINFQVKNMFFIHPKNMRRCQFFHHLFGRHQFNLLAFVTSERSTLFRKASDLTKLSKNLKDF